MEVGYQLVGQFLAAVALAHQEALGIHQAILRFLVRAPRASPKKGLDLAVGYW